MQKQRNIGISRLEVAFVSAKISSIAEISLHLRQAFFVLQSTAAQKLPTSGNYRWLFDLIKEWFSQITRPWFFISPQRRSLGIYELGRA